MKLSVLIIGLLLASAGFADCGQRSAPTQPEKDLIKVMLWNAKQSAGVKDQSAIEVAQSNDMFLFQEVDKIAVQSFVSKIGLENKSKTTIHNNLSFGVASVTSLKPCEDYSIDVTDEPVMASVDKAIVVQKFKFKTKNGKFKILKVINTHLPLFLMSTSYGNGAYKDGLAKLSKEVQQHDGPVVVAGDFNGWTPNRIMYLLPEFAKKNELEELTFSLNSGNRAATLYLDRFFYKGLSVIEEDTITSIASSDHFIRKIGIELH